MTEMYEKTEEYQQLEVKVWQNLNNCGLLATILKESRHADDISKYVGVELWDEFSLNTRIGECVMWVQIYLRQAMPVQPVTPKIYRITGDGNIGEQKKICAKIWNGVSAENLKYIALVSAEEYARGRRWMEADQRRDMGRFLPAARRGELQVELIPKLAQFMVYVTER